MTLEEYVRRVGSFDRLSLTDQIRLFAWFLHTQESKQVFRTADLNDCFDRAHCHRPANTSQLISSRVGRDVIKEGDAFKLTLPAREEIEKKYGDRHDTIEVHELLSSLPASLPGAAQSDYLSEALVCFRHQAFRAATIMTWNVTYDHLVESLSAKHLNTFNGQMAQMFGGKKKTITGRDDFQRLKESEVIEVCNASGLISKEVAKVLTDKLDKRNSAAHPSGSKVDRLQSEAYISDLIKNALLKIS